MFKKEHLGLDEVGKILRNINQDKKAFDRQRGKREHEFFLPSGRKILKYWLGAIYISGERA